jgi:lysophospholipase L1-like esterase
LPDRRVATIRKKNGPAATERFWSGLQHMNKRIVQWSLACAVGLIAFTAARVVIILRNTDALKTVSEQFPPDYWVGPDSGARLVYVALGDSTAAGTGVDRVEETIPYGVALMLAAQHRRVHVLNLAVSGARIADVLLDQLPEALKLKPDVVTICVGANDATHFTPLDKYRRDYDVVLASLQAAKVPLVIAATSPDLHYTPAVKPIFSIFSGNRAAQENAILTDIAARHNVKIVDFYARGELVAGQLYASDDFHPSALGYARWTALYAPILRGLGEFSPRAHPVP